MGLLDWFRTKPHRSSTAIARELSEVVFSLHPTALDRVVLRLGGGVVLQMEVPALDPERVDPGGADRGALTARVSELCAELRRSAPPTSGDELTVMRDRVIWMPSVIPF